MEARSSASAPCPTRKIKSGDDPPDNKHRSEDRQEASIIESNDLCTVLTEPCQMHKFLSLAERGENSVSVHRAQIGRLCPDRVFEVLRGLVDGRTGSSARVLFLAGWKLEIPAKCLMRQIRSSNECLFNDFFD